MIRPVELLIGLRYTRAKRRNHFISFISLSSMLGIAVGVWALITVLSIMNGFERELRERILSVASHVTVGADSGWLADWPALAERIGRHPEVRDWAPYILGQGMITRSGEVTGALVRGILPERERVVSNVIEAIESGTIDDLVPGEYGIVLGADLAFGLGVEVGSKVTVVVPQGQVTPAGLMPRLRRFTVVAIFDLGMYEYDSGLALIHIEDAGRLLRSEGRVSGLRLTIDDVYRAPLVSRDLRNMLGRAFVVSDWTREHANFFRALKIEKRVMFIILMLIVAVAAFNIVSTLVMVVTDKRPDVAILRTIGLSPRSVMTVFMIQGTLIGLVGVVTGGVTGVLTAINVETLVPAIESLLGIEFFPSSIYVITDFPAEMRWPDVYRIVGVAFVLSVLATIYPAIRASRTEPAEALHHE
jgi:lipoprotein-releasing system permease protein